MKRLLPAVHADSADRKRQTHLTIMLFFICVPLRELRAKSLAWEEEGLTGTERT